MLKNLTIGVRLTLGFGLLAALLLGLSMCYCRQWGCGKRKALKPRSEYHQRRALRSCSPAVASGSSPSPFVPTLLSCL